MCDYAEVDNHVEYTEKIVGYTDVIYNYTPDTMPWLSSMNINPNKNTMWIKRPVQNSIFLNSIDLENLMIPLRVQRFEESPIDNFINYRVDGVPVFGVISPMMYRRAVECVSKKYNSAIIKILLGPQETLTDIQVHNPNVKVIVCKDPVDDLTVLKFLSSNDLNLFFYNGFPSDVTEKAVYLALCSGKPLATSNSIIFKDIFHQSMMLLHDNDLIDNWDWCLKNSVSHIHSLTTRKIVNVFEKALFPFYSLAGQDLWVLRTLGYRPGRFLEFGSPHPVVHNNTYMLSKCGWTGVSMGVDKDILPVYRQIRQDTECTDTFPSIHFDYVSLGVPSLEILESVKQSNFKMLTMRHDDNAFIREESRRILKSWGYGLIHSDVTVDKPYEDWWIRGVFEMESNGEKFPDFLF